MVTSERAVVVVAGCPTPVAAENVEVGYTRSLIPKAHFADICPSYS